MRKLLLLAPSLLAACSTAPAAAPYPVHGETPGHRCTTAGTERFVGQTANKEIAAEIMRVSKAAVLRWAPPGVMLTMDFRADRVTIHLGPDRKITDIKCG